MPREDGTASAGTGLSAAAAGGEGPRQVETKMQGQGGSLTLCSGLLYIFSKKPELRRAKRAIQPHSVLSQLASQLAEQSETAIEKASHFARPEPRPQKEMQSETASYRLHCNRQVRS